MCAVLLSIYSSFIMEPCQKNYVFLQKCKLMQDEDLTHDHFVGNIPLKELCTFSMLIPSGMVMMHRQPFTAAVRARPRPADGQRRIQATCHVPLSYSFLFSRLNNKLFLHLSLQVPVLPEVGSMIVSPGLRIPARSASSTIRTAILSFTLPPALKNSHLATK